MTSKLTQWHPADRRHDLGLGVVCERGNRNPDDKRKATSKDGPCEGESSEAGTRDGLASKSCEGVVMTVEQRG